jgi:hypothetical protein
MVPKLFFAYCTWCIDLVTKDEEGHLGELLNWKEGIQLGLWLGKALKVGAIDEKDNAVDLGEIVTPETACCKGWAQMRNYGSKTAHAPHAPCWWPPKSYVVNFTLPIASSSEAKSEALEQAIPKYADMNERTWVERRLEGS